MSRRDLKIVVSKQSFHIGALCFRAIAEVNSLTQPTVSPACSRDNNKTQLNGTIEEGK